MARIDIPLKIEDALLDLKGLGELISATEWKRAAIVWAFTEEGTAGRPSNEVNVVKSDHISIQAFAEMGISGLASRNTIKKYRKAWQRAIDVGAAKDVQPGQRVTLPDLDWQSYFNPGKTPADPKPDIRQDWSEGKKSVRKSPPELDVDLELSSFGDSDELADNQRLVKFGQRLWYVIDDVEQYGREGEMLKRISDSITDVIVEENKFKAIAHLLDAVTELASYRHGELRSISR